LKVHGIPAGAHRCYQGLHVWFGCWKPSTKSAFNFGKGILQIVPGRVSTEVDARVSYEQPRLPSPRRAKLIRSYHRGRPSARIRLFLIKIASPAEGHHTLQSSLQLRQGHHCNLTLLPQLSPRPWPWLAEAKVNPDLPLCGVASLDWYQKRTTDVITYPGPEDPGVISS